MQSDQLFKEFLRTFLAEFFGLFLPAEAALIDWQSLTFLDKEVFTDSPLGQVRDADLVIEARTRGAEPQTLLLHIEVQDKRYADFGKRMWEYYSLLRLRHEKEVFPLAIYLSKGNSGGVTEAEYAQFALGKNTLTFPYTVISLPDLPADEWADKAGAVSAALATLMDSPRGKRARRAFESLKKVWLSPLTEAQKLLLSDIVDRLGRSRLGKQEERVYEGLLASQEAKEIKPMISSFEERAMNRGKERGIVEGIERGIAEGIHEGQVRFAVRLLTRKFGAAAAELETSVKALSTANLEAMTDALLDFTSLTEAQAWLKTHTTER